mgnify:CR=1 FL=1
MCVDYKVGFVTSNVFLGNNLLKSVIYEHADLCKQFLSSEGLSANHRAVTKDD